MKLILGSASKYRQEVLRSLGYEFEVVASAFDEQSVRSVDPIILVRELARGKSVAIVSQLSEPAIVITADQVLDVNGELREKPKDLDQARQFLESYRNSTVHHVNGLCVVNTATGKRREGFDVTSFSFGDFPQDVIETLLSKGNVMKAAGAMMSQNPLMKPYITAATGTFESCMGMPVDLVRQLIDEVQS